MVDLLIYNNADVNLADKIGMTPICYAAYHGARKTQKVSKFIHFRIIISLKFLKFLRQIRIRYNHDFAIEIWCGCEFGDRKSDNANAVTLRCLTWYLLVFVRVCIRNQTDFINPMKLNSKK